MRICTSALSSIYFTQPCEIHCEYQVAYIQHHCFTPFDTYGGSGGRGHPPFLGPLGLSTSLDQAPRGARDLRKVLIRT
jgi:hypothetical protein